MDPNKGVTPESRARGHEERDIRMGGPLLFGLILAVGLVISYGVTRWLFHEFVARADRVQQPGHALAGGAGVARPPEPRLQMNPVADFREIREGEERVLNSYGWVDKDAGVARIPIDRAIELLAEQKLPSRDQAGAESGGEVAE
jgi:hypothetical protein